MKTYRIIEKVIDLRQYYVEAKSKKAAREMYENGEVGCSEYIDNLDASLNAIEEIVDKGAVTP